MRLTEASHYPIGDEWVYETKYDGFRCILHWTEQQILFKTRNGKELTAQFPEIVQFCQSIHEHMYCYLPLTFDGEIVYLRSPFQSAFPIVQQRGRLRNPDTIASHAKTFPCHYIVFDLLMLQGSSLQEQPFNRRRKEAEQLFQALHLPLTVQPYQSKKLQCIESFTDPAPLWKAITQAAGEGIVAKKKTSKWIEQYRSPHWVKVKNWRHVHVILTTFDKNNGYFKGAVYRENTLIPVVTFRHGLRDEEFNVLATFFESQGELIESDIWRLPPFLCVTISCIGLDGQALREPRFHSFAFELSPEHCQWNTLLHQLAPLPESVITHAKKPIWSSIALQKDDYLLYLKQIAPYLLPFLKDRLLTVIRSPHGVEGEAFYQKSTPSYAPSFIQTAREDGIPYILCNDLETLVWLGNQLAIEFHVPFQTIHSACPREIVFDLDPPSIDAFPLAIEAAQLMKRIFDELRLTAFVKTSGGKGLQVYIPLPPNTFTYKQTRIFTSFVCNMLLAHAPDRFTTERLKKHRGKRLYLDYIQHQAGKTIIAPYSPRIQKNATVATPCYWEELTPSLFPTHFTIKTILERLESIGDPFRPIHEGVEQPHFAEVLHTISAMDDAVH